MSYQIKIHYSLPEATSPETAAERLRRSMFALLAKYGVSVTEHTSDQLCFRVPLIVGQSAFVPFPPLASGIFQVRSTPNGLEVMYRVNLGKFLILITTVFIIGVIAAIVTGIGIKLAEYVRQSSAIVAIAWLLVIAYFYFYFLLLSWIYLRRLQFS